MGRGFFVRLFVSLLTIALAGLVGSPAYAATVSVSLSSDNSSCANGTYDNTNESSLCSKDGSGTFDDWGANWSTAGGTSSNLVGLGSTSTTFTIDAKVATDDGGVDVGQGGDRWIQASLDFDLSISIDVDNVGDSWSLNLNQSVLGLFGLNGDGTLSAVGTQDNGYGEITTIATTVNASAYNFGATPTSYSNNPSNTSKASAQFSGVRNDSGVLSGTGDANFTANISFDLEALSNDGCSGFICSSASGGEEAAVLFGYGGGVIDQDVDDYSYWSRSSGPDGYNSTWTLNVTELPEPGLGVLLASLAAGTWLASRRRH